MEDGRIIDYQFPIPNSQFPIPNSQFPIPNSQFPIPDSQFAILLRIVTPIAIDLVADRIRSIVPSIEYLYYPELVPQARYTASLHSQLAPQLN